MQPLRTRTPSPSVEFWMTEYERMRHSDPMLVAPRSCDERLDHRVGADRHFGVDHAGIRAEDGDALRHQAAGCGRAHGCVQVHHLGDGVGAQDFVDGVCLDGDDALAIRNQQRGNVGQVELAVGDCRSKASRARSNSACGAEAVDAGVDLRRDCRARDGATSARQSRKPRARPALRITRP